MNGNPYVGPRAFKTGEVLNGRDRELRQLLELLIAERIVLMYSPSGAGKTSLIQAGLIPALTKEEFLVLPVMRVSSVLSTEEKAELSANGNVNTFNRYVLSALLSLQKTQTQQHLPLAQLASMHFTDYLGQPDQYISGPLRTGMERGRKKQQLPRVLIFDQFEELLTVDPTDQPAKEEFFDQVGAALRNRDCWALFSMREDYSAGLDPFLRRVPTRLATTFRLDLLGEQAGRLAIQEPSRRAGVEFREDAAQKLINDLRTVVVQQSDGSMKKQLGLHIEPVQLQVVCRRLWEELPADTREIVPGDLETIGDVNTALSGYYADQVKAAATESVSERTIREWFDNYLITDQGIRGQVLQGRIESKGLRNEVIKPLIDAHLVRAEKRLGATWFELAHDRLIDPVQRDNAAWLQANLNDFQRQAALWQTQGRPDNLLIYGPGLVEGEEWVESHQPELTLVEHDFFEKCREAREQAKRERDREAKLELKRRQARRNRTVAAVMTLISLIAVISLVKVGFQKRELRKQNEATVQANQLLGVETTKANELRELAEKYASELEQKRSEEGEIARLQQQLNEKNLSLIDRKLSKAAKGLKQEARAPVAEAQGTPENKNERLQELADELEFIRRQLKSKPGEKSSGPSKDGSAGSRQPH